MVTVHIRTIDISTTTRGGERTIQTMVAEIAKAMLLLMTISSASIQTATLIQLLKRPVGSLLLVLTTVTMSRALLTAGANTHMVSPRVRVGVLGRHL
jgi:hypothetical protein